MHLVLVHGYLLTGAGSNVYTANVAKYWKRQGHAVTIVCQDHFADRLDFVDELIIGTEKIPNSAPRPGTVRVVVPDINGLLIVFCYDLYEGFVVKTMVTCSLDEIEANIKKTAEGLKKVIDQGVDRIFANHAILSPVITRRAAKGTAVPYDVKIHGSAITFSVKKRPELTRYAVEGLKHCRKIITGTKFIAGYVNETFAPYLDVILLEEKTVVIPPGMDPEVFQLGGSIEERQRAFLASVEDFIKRKPGGRKASNISLPPHTTQDLQRALTGVVESYQLRAVDADLCERWKLFRGGEPVICFIGKFQDTKGVGELLVAFPTILRRFPEARLLLAGYGPNREHLEGMLTALEQGSLEAFKAYAEAGGFVDFPQDGARFFRKLCPKERDRIVMTGMLEHAQLKEILPLCCLSVVGSKWIEAFGMVAVEAMAAGVLPLCNDHTGIASVLQTVQEVEPELGDLMRLETRPGGTCGTADGAYLAEQLPNKVETALRFIFPNGFGDNNKRQEFSARLRAVAMAKFSWDGICKRILDT